MNEKNEHSKVITTEDGTFEQSLQKHPVVVVDCWAPWCAPCRMIAPMIEELARDYAGKVVFAKLNVDENPKTASQYRIMAIPTLLIFKNGKLADQIVGVVPREILEPRIKKYLQMRYSNKPIKVKDKNFDEIITKYPLLVVDCWAPWCAPCKRIAPIIRELADDYAGIIVFGKLNVDKNREVSSRYGLRSIPTLLVFKDGKLIERIKGAKSKERIEGIMKFRGMIE